jgi:hypothetical protein
VRALIAAATVKKYAASSKSAALHLYCLFCSQPCSNASVVCGSITRYAEKHARVPVQAAAPTGSMGEQLPTSFGDYFDGVVHYFDGGLIVDRICRNLHASGPFLYVGEGCVRKVFAIQVRT